MGNTKNVIKSYLLDTLSNKNSYCSFGMNLSEISRLTESKHFKAEIQNFKGGKCPSRAWNKMSPKNIFSLWT
jgi:hypothetical protein